jgi:hypothetical protein
MALSIFFILNLTESTTYLESDDVHTICVSADKRFGLAPSVNLLILTSGMLPMVFVMSL